MLYVNPLDAYSAGRAPSQGSLGKKETLQEFERLFLYQLLREMRNTVPEDGIFKKSGQQELFEEMLDDFMAGEMAKSGQFGITEAMARQLEATPPADTEKPSAAGFSLQRDASKALPLKSAHTGLALESPRSKGIALPREAPGIRLSVDGSVSK